MKQRPWWAFTAADVVFIPFILVVVFSLSSWPSGFWSWAIMPFAIGVGHLLSCWLFGRRGER